MQATALWHLSPTHSALKKEALPTSSKHPIKIKSLYSLVSTGTERLVATGKVPAEMYDPMKVPYMGGNFDFPIKYGYSLVGEILTEGELLGQLVHLLHPHQDLLVADNQSIDLIPQGVPAKRAALASNVETALNAIWDGGVTVGDKVLVSGFGMIGGLVARLLSFMPAVEVVVLEKNEFRRQLARQMGFTINPTTLN
ncbi:MAG: zinc-binding alcohol dehydrogenase, partial [Bacteroidota bacterium]